jgi:hypothetical protein
MANVVPLHIPNADEAPYRAPAIFDDADGPGRLAARWRRDDTVAITVADGRGVGLPSEFHLAASTCPIRCVSVRRRRCCR